MDKPITKEDITKAVEESIAHWKRMIAWVEKQNPDDPSYYNKMFTELDEKWHSENCPLCNLFGKGCSECPLARKYHRCGISPNIWIKVSRSKTWGEWLTNAKEMLKQLESLL